MSVHLVGGGWLDEPDGAVFAAFLGEAQERADAAGREAPRIAVVAVRDGDELDHASRLVAAAAPAGTFEPLVTAVPLAGPVPARRSPASTASSSAAA